MTRDLLRFLTCGSVDDGKSTLIGRMLLDADVVAHDRRVALEADSRRYGTVDGALDPALLTDGLKAEREQGITIDVAYRYFSTPRRTFILADTPGHEQYTRNMVSGASRCDLAVLLVDARHGLQPQTRRHAAIVSILGIRHLILAVNKMDLVGFDEATYDAICREFLRFAPRLTAVDVQCVPISALGGDNVVRRSSAMPWYRGSTLLHVLETVQVATGRNPVDLRLPIQSVVKLPGGRRGYQGSVRSGSVRVGERVVVLPSGESATVSAITGSAGAVDSVTNPEAVTLELDVAIDVSRGDLFVHPRNQPHVTHRLEAMIVWMGGRPLAAGERYLVKHLTTTATATLVQVDYRLQIETLHREPADVLALNDCGRCLIECDRPLLWDAYERNRSTGAFILIDRVTYDTVGVGMAIDRMPVPADARGDQARGPRALTIWLTGLSGSGKSTIAVAVEARLREAGVACIVLDGDRMREGLNSDLSFSMADRRENVRRNAEVARLFNQAGFVVLVPVISPLVEDRDRARHIVGRDNFREVWVDASLEVCEARDVKGLYKKARAGEVPEFTGISSPYEPPVNPDLIVRTSELSVDEAARAVVTLVVA